MPAGDVLSWFPVGLVFEMGQKDGWGQYSGCPGRGCLGSVDLGAGGSLGVLSLWTLRDAVRRSGGSCLGVGLEVLGRAREGTS